MYLPPLQPLCNSDSYVSGDVTIDPSAIIGPGVLLAAEPNSRIVIAAGVCIGMGTILHAQEGVLEVQTGAVLGAGVLMVGAGKVGANACVGSCTTILYSSIQSKQVVLPGSLVGDKSRKVLEATVTTETPENNNAQTEQPVKPVAENNGASSSRKAPETKPPETKPPETKAPEVKPPEAKPPEVKLPEVKPPEVRSIKEVGSESAAAAGVTSEPEPIAIEIETPASASVQVYGQIHLNRLLLTLFPHNQNIKPPFPDGKAE